MAHEDITNALGVYFGGIWFDHADSGKAKIGVAPPGDTDDLEDVLDEYELADDAVIVPVAARLSDLNDTQEAAADSIEDHSGDAPFEVGVDISENSVVARISDELSAGEVEEIEDDLSGEPVEVDIDQVDESELAFESGACTTNEESSLYCDKPLRGGVRIFGPGVCTAGFMTKTDGSNHLAVLTAGHCMGDGYWKSRVFTSGYEKNISAAEFGQFSGGIDAARIWVSNTSYWHGAGRGFVVFWPENETYWKQYYIRNYRHQFTTEDEGKMVCQTSGPVLLTGHHSVCGDITKVNTSWPYNGQRISHLNVYKSCGGRGGSSGGPVFKNHLAHGIFVAYNLDNCRSAYFQIGWALDATNTHLILEGVEGGD